MNQSSPAQPRVDQKNAQFWDKLCGTHHAKQLGIKDHSPESLARFDAWFFDYYPYLLPFLPMDGLATKDVLEIGLGYGSLSQRLAAAGCRFHGLDIAAGPVAMAAQRLEQMGLRGDVRQGSILAPPFQPGSFDWIVSIGCLHHTGNLAAAIENVHSLLRPGGHALIMVYNAASYRQWILQPRVTLRQVFSDKKAYANSHANTQMTNLYDRDSSGKGAPATEFVTKAELGHLCRAFARCRIWKKNIGGARHLFFIPRRIRLLLGPVVGLDLYCRLEK